MSGFKISERIASFRYAAQGIATMIRTQHNARFHVFAAVLVCVAGFALEISSPDWKWLILTIAIVWAAEAMNTAFEYLCDVVSPQHSEAVKHAKDIAAGAVLICAIAALVMAALIFAPYL